MKAKCIKPIIDEFGDHQMELILNENYEYRIILTDKPADRFIYKLIVKNKEYSLTTEYFDRYLLDITIHRDNQLDTLL
jgi:hypothetical protein